MANKFVYRKTLVKKVGGGLSGPNEMKLGKIAGYDVLVTRASKLHKYGSPIHIVSIFDKKGRVTASAKGVADPSLLAQDALKKVGIETKYPKPWYEKKKRK